MKGYVRLVHFAADGTEIGRTEGWNKIPTEHGEFLKDCVFLQSTARPAKFYIGLSKKNTQVSADTLSNTTASYETTGSNYARQEISAGGTDFTASTQGSGWWFIKTATATFSAKGNWTSANTVFLATGSAATGYLLGVKSTGGQRELTNGDYIKVDYTVVFKEAT